jgi:DNA-binding LacI/PurR family transcriptional regulator
VVLCNSAEDPRRERQYVEVLCAEPVAGAIVVPASDRKSTFRLFTERGIPVVSIDRHVRDGAVDSVMIDNVAAAREAVAHLIAGGYRRIGLITGPEGATTARERREGYRLALHEAGLLQDPRLERGGPFTEDSAWHLVEELLDLKPPIDALFTGNNRLTMGALQALHARDLRVPEDVGLVGFDDVPWTPPGAISLTTVIQPAYEIGHAATARLIERLTYHGAMARREIVLAHQFRVGDSSRRRAYVSAPAVG